MINLVNGNNLKKNRKHLHACKIALNSKLVYNQTQQMNKSQVNLLNNKKQYYIKINLHQSQQPEKTEKWEESRRP